MYLVAHIFGANHVTPPASTGQGQGLSVELLHPVFWSLTSSSLYGAAKFISTMTFSEDCLSSLHSITNSHSDNPTVPEIRDAARKVTFIDGTTSTDRVKEGTVKDQFARQPLRYATGLMGVNKIYWRPGYESTVDPVKLKGAVCMSYCII
jgi:hypothetical protein